MAKKSKKEVTVSSSSEEVAASSGSSSSSSSSSSAKKPAPKKVAKKVSSSSSSSSSESEKKPAKKVAKKVSSSSSSSSSESEEKKPVKKVAKKSSSSSSSSSSESEKKPAKKAASKKTKKSSSSSSSDDDSVEITESKAPAKSKKSSSSEEDSVPESVPVKRAAPAADASPSKPGSDSHRSIFIGGLPFNTTEEDLRSAFTDGTITRVSVLGKGASAFIAFSTEEEARAQTKWNDTDFGGRKIRVNMADDKPTQSPGGDAKRPARSDDKERTIFCGGLKFGTTEEDLRSLFSEGSIERVSLMGKGGAAFIAFSTAEEAKSQLKWHDTDYCGRKLNINMAGDRPAAPAGRR